MARRVVNSYDREASLPVPGSFYVWELDSPTARALIEVVGVIWNGEEWWVRTRTLLPRPSELATMPGHVEATDLNDLDRFWEAVTAVRELHGQPNVRYDAFRRYEVASATDELGSSPSVSVPVAPAEEQT